MGEIPYQIKIRKNFVDCNEIDQKSILDLLHSLVAKKQRGSFFSTFKDLVAGYLLQVGINDLGQGNQPNFWDGVPDEIMKEHGFSYEKIGIINL